jgi:hypothetical protein
LAIISFSLKYKINLLFKCNITSYLLLVFINKCESLLNVTVKCWILFYSSQLYSKLFSKIIQTNKIFMKHCIDVTPLSSSPSDILNLDIGNGSWLEYTDTIWWFLAILKSTESDIDIQLYAIIISFSLVCVWVIYYSKLWTK